MGATEIIEILEDETKFETIFNRQYVFECTWI